MSRNMLDVAIPTREHILREIRRLADENGGAPVGVERFEAETDIRHWQWNGRYWARWSDAVREAGFEPNTWNGQGLTDDQMLEALALVTRDLGKFPTRGELGLRRRSHPELPVPNTFTTRFGNRPEQMKRLVAFADVRPEFADVAALCAPALARSRDREPQPVNTDAPVTGVVYMIRMDEYYKVGRSNDLDRRTRELRTQLPVREELVHVIETDDPGGIEAYWHRRFATSRANGEWFRLSSGDVEAFRRRSYM